MKALLNKIPPNRLIIYLLILGLAPLFFIGYQCTQKCNGWNLIAERLQAVQSAAHTQARKQLINEVVRQTYSNADQFYLENQLEPLCFLKKESDALEKLIQNPSFTGNEAAEKRYHYLSSSSNKLEFAAGTAQSGEEFQESLYHLTHPVEIDAHDIKEILTRIEGKRKTKPQLLITDFKIQKQVHTNGSEVFALTMKLLKREFS